MSPEGKASLVSELQKETNEIIAMCGDGANDCNALKTADVGLSLSEAEASIAAPFTSKIQDISPIIRLLREGRAALVTSFAAFKYIELYSMIQFWTVIILYRIASNLGDFQFLYIDLFHIIPLFIVMGYTESHTKLSKKMPTGALISVPVLFSVLSQIIIQSSFQFGIFFLLKSQEWYEPLKPHDDKNTLCQENTVLFLFSTLQYSYIVITFSISKPFRKSMFTNIGLWVTLTVLFIIDYSIIVIPWKFFRKLLVIETLPKKFRLYIIFGSFINALVSYFFERVVVLGIIDNIISRRKLAKRVREK